MYRRSFRAEPPAEGRRTPTVPAIDDPGPEFVRTRRYFGSQVAAPVVRRVLERSLSYLGIPPDATPESLAAAGGAAPD